MTIITNKTQHINTFIVKSFFFYDAYASPVI